MSEIHPENRKLMDKYAPLDDLLVKRCPSEFREQFRFTLAKKRKLEVDHARLAERLSAFADLIKEFM